MRKPREKPAQLAGWAIRFPWEIRTWGGWSLHYIWRSGLSRSGMLSFNAARIRACSGLGRATRRRASFLPSVVSRRMSPIWILPQLPQDDLWRHRPWFG